MSLPRAMQEAEEKANNMIQGNTDKAPEVTPETQAIEPQTETPQAEALATSDDVDWKAKYQVLQGKYNKEVKAINNKAANFEATQPTEASSTLSNENEQLRQQVAQLQAQAPKDQPTLNSHLVSEYGEEFATAVNESATAQVSNLRDEFEQRFTKQQKDISSWTNESKRSAVIQALAGLQIDFNLVDNDPLFGDWLKEADQYSGLTRHSMLMNAFEGGELDRVTRFYSAFVESTKVHADQHPFSQHIEAPQSAAQDVGTTPAVFDADAFAQLHRTYQRGGMSDAEFAKAEREMYAALSR